MQKCLDNRVLLKLGVVCTIGDSKYFDSVLRVFEVQVTGYNYTFWRPNGELPAVRA